MQDELEAGLALGRHFQADDAGAAFGFEGWVDVDFHRAPGGQVELGPQQGRERVHR